MIYCEHEYTIKNIEFAKTIEPDNIYIQNKLYWSINQINNQLFTIPSYLKEEKEYNTFMRVNNNNIKNNLNINLDSNPILVMKRLREMKDKF